MLLIAKYTKPIQRSNYQTDGIPIFPMCQIRRRMLSDWSECLLVGMTLGRGILTVMNSLYLGFVYKTKTA